MGEIASTINEIDKMTLILLLYLPVVATIVGIARHLAGVRTFSMYLPIIITYAFVQIGLDEKTGNIDFWYGLKHGLLIILMVFSFSTALYRYGKRLNLHFFPKISLIFSLVSLLALGGIILAAYLGMYGFSAINPFAFILIIVASERFLTYYAKASLKNTINISITTLLISLIGFLIISIPDFRSFLLQYPVYVNLVIIIINIYIGRYGGLRLTEYWRFRKVLDQDTETKNGAN